jgi:hypothetical protein
MTIETVTIIANLALTFSFIVGLIFGIIQVKAAARDRKERLTLETLRNYQTREFAELNFNINAKIPPATLEEFQKFVDGDQIKFVQFIQVMGSLGILVAEGLIDIDLVDKTLGTLVADSWSKLKPFITDMREKAPAPFFGEYYQWLAERLNERLKMNPRKPFHELV